LRSLVIVKVVWGYAFLVLLILSCADLGSSSDINENANFAFNFSWVASDAEIPAPGDEVRDIVLEIASSELTDIKRFVFDYNAKEGQITGIPIGIEIDVTIKIISADGDEVFYRGSVSNVTTTKQTQLSINLEKQPPTAPANVTISDKSAHTLMLTWEDRSFSEFGYEIQRRVEGESTFDSIATVSADDTGFTDGNLIPETSYEYRIAGWNEAGDGSWSESVLGITKPRSVYAPDGPTYLQVSAQGNESVTLIWEDNADNENNFIIDRKASGDPGFKSVKSLPENSHEWVDSVLSEGLTYLYRVYAVNDSGFSTFTNIESVYVAKSEELYFSVTLLPDPPDGGTVSKTPDSNSYFHEQEVIIEATPAKGYRFIEWSGGDPSKNAITTIDVTEDKTVRAHFSLKPYTFEVLVDGNGSVRPDNLPDTVFYGDSLTLTAVPDSAWEFTGWNGSDTGIVLGVKITGNTSITAVFNEKGKVRVIADPSPLEGGTVKVEPDSSQFLIGEEISLSASPNEGYEFVNWTGDLDDDAQSFTLKVLSTTNVTANFKKKKYTVTLLNALSDSIIAEHGDTIDIVENIPEGFVFNSWTIPSGSDGLEILDKFARETKVVVTGDGTIRAKSDTAKYTLHLNDADVDSVIVNHGVPVTIRFATPGNQDFRRWIITDGSPEITNVDEANTQVILTQGNAGIAAEYNYWPELTDSPLDTIIEKETFNDTIIFTDGNSDNITIVSPDIHTIPWLTMRELSNGRIVISGTPYNNESDQTFVFELHVTDSVIKQNIIETVSYYVKPVNDLPVITECRSDTVVSIFDTVPFYASVVDTEQTAISYSWDFDGDGNFDKIIENENNTTYNYPSHGDFNVVLRVTDKDGGYSDTSFNIIVEQGLPHVDAGNVVTVEIDTFADATAAVTLNGSASDSNGNIIKYEWVIPALNQNFSSDVSSAFTFATDSADTFVCSLCVTDDDLNRNCDTTSLIVLDTVLKVDVYEINPASNYAIIEAEDLIYSDNWKLEDSTSGYNGSGYLRWNGDYQSCYELGVPDDGNGNDTSGECQGPKEDWLIFSVKFTEPGAYEINVRNYHDSCDGSNDCWISSYSDSIAPRIDYPISGTWKRKIYRFSDNYPLGEWSWSENKTDLFFTYIIQIDTATVISFYCAGRSRDFKIDRFSIARLQQGQIVLEGMDCNTQKISSNTKSAVPAELFDPELLATEPSGMQLLYRSFLSD